jgi:hypothetical protein
MIEVLKTWRDRVLGRGEAAITIPTLDGACKPNRLLEDADVLLNIDAPEDLATDGIKLFATDGNLVLRFDAGKPAEHIRFDKTITAIACIPQGGMAVALDGRQIRIVGGPFDKKEWSSANGSPLLSINAISATDDGRLLATEGSAQQPYERWCHDLMELGHSGRLLEFNLARGDNRELRQGMHFAFGCCVSGSSVIVSETWKHRLIRAGVPASDEIVVDWLPGYPGRITASPGGGFWLTAFAGRTQLVEFVLREKAYRRRMINEVDPRYWIAPALSSTDDFLEPLQGAHVKTRGVLKPYAPPRSYGLVIRLDAEGIPVSSFQSRLDGKNHGVVAAVECKGVLYALSKGSRRILQLPVSKE